jgi:glycosyltransferase involved in cell wall biosynthesis
MKIGYDAKRLYANSTGLGTYSRTLINRLMQYYPKDEYTLFVHQKHYQSTLYKYAEYTEKTIVSDYFNDKIWRRKAIAEDVVNQSIDIFHGLSNELPELPNNIKKIVTVHDVIYKKLPKTFSYFDRKLYHYKTKKALEQADAIVAVSQQTKADIIESYNTAEDKTHVIYPTWNKEYEHECNYLLKDEYFARYGLPRDFVLYVGAISKRKNFIRLLEAMALPENRDKHLVVVSNGGDEYDKAESFIYDKGLEASVFFLKDLPWYELPIIYHMSQGLIYPSMYEGFGLPVLEALRCGKPVITSNISSMPEVGGDACIFINPTSIEEISSAINFIYYNLDLAAEIKVKAMAQVQKFAPEKMTEKMMNVYKSLM